MFESLSLVRKSRGLVRNLASADGYRLIGIPRYRRNREGLPRQRHHPWAFLLSQGSW
jgi:hypothetical protein